MNNDHAQLDLLILDQLVRPTDTALDVLADAREEINSHLLRPVSLAALYALAVSQLEIAIADTIRYILKRNPWRMNFAEIRAARDELLSMEFVRELLESHAEDLVRRWSYGPITHLFERLVDVADLPKATLPQHAEVLAELRERRNEILHCAPPQSDWVKKPRVWTSPAETRLCIERAAAILSDIRAALALRYAAHTHVAALRRLWSYLFTSPIMQFDDYWVIDSAKDRVVAIKADAPVGRLATSERILLGLWQAEFAGDASLLREFNMKRLDSRRRRDVVTLIAALRDIWLY